jgi:hypothetical protein
MQPSMTRLRVVLMLSSEKGSLQGAYGMLACVHVLCREHACMRSCAMQGACWYVKL